MKIDYSEDLGFRRVQGFKVNSKNNGNGRINGNGKIHDKVN
jgi:hypothetical protein